MLPTSVRSGARGDYVIEIHKESRYELKLGKYAVVTHEFPVQKKGIRFLAYGKVLINNNLEKDCVKIDQTLRDAVRLSFIDKVSLHKLELSATQQMILFLRRFFSARNIWAYVFKAYPRDMEKNICRLSQGAREVLGVSQGDLLRLESIFFDKNSSQYKLRSITLRVFDLSDVEITKTGEESIKSIQEFESVGENQIKDFESRELPFARIDKEARVHLSSEGDEIEELQPIKISPNIWYLVRNRVQFYIINLFLALVGTVITIREFSMTAGILVLVSALIILTIGVYLDIKNKIS